MCKGCGWVLVWQFLWGQEMVNFPAPQKLDPKISPHGSRTVYDSVCGAGSGQFSCPTKTRPQGMHTIYDSDHFLPHKNSTPSPKIEPKPWYFRCLCKAKTTSVAKTPSFATLSQHIVRNAVFYSVFGPPSQKHWYLQCFVKTHAWNIVNTNEFKDYTFHGNKPQKAKTLIFTAFLRNDFSKKMFFLDNFWLLKPPKTKRGGNPPPQFHILNFKIFTKSKTWQFLELKTRPERHFLMVFTIFLHAPKFLHKKCNSKNYQKITKKQTSCWRLAFWGPLAPHGPFPRAIFDGICDVLCTSSTLQKRAVFFCLRGAVGGRRTSPYS